MDPDNKQEELELKTDDTDDALAAAVKAAAEASSPPEPEEVESAPEPEPKPEPEEELTAEDAKAAIAALRERFPDIEPVAPVETIKTEAEDSAEIPDESAEQLLMLSREQRRWTQEIGKAENEFKGLESAIEDKTAALEELDPSSKAYIALAKDIAKLEASQREWSRYHAESHRMLEHVAQVREEISIDSRLKQYPHDYLDLLKSGRVTPGMRTAEILTAIHAHRAALGKPTPATVTATGKPATAQDKKDAVRAVLKKIGAERPGGKPSATERAPAKKSTLTDDALQALEIAKR